MAGQIGTPGTGLDAPQDTRAAAMPGTPGHKATNFIDSQGGLDPRGMTIDGNNSAGTPKDMQAEKAAHGSVCNVLLSRVTVDTLPHRVLGPTHKRYRQEAMQSNLDLTTAISRRNHPFLRLQDLVRN